MGLAAVAATVAAVTLSATPALALGNNRVVYRSCGENYVASGFNSEYGYSWAQTEKDGGDCSGRLSAALKRDNGTNTPRRYGTNGSAWATDYSPFDARNGLHWGCDNCNVTYS